MSAGTAKPAPSPSKTAFRRWLSSPPRPHGAVDVERTVSNLELFYDLVYVAVIGAASKRLSVGIGTDPVGAVVDFAVVFAMVWIAWLNGSLYIELHGREDGRTRLLVFLQMGLLALLAVFTGNAAASPTGSAGSTASTGFQFALVYALFLAVMTWQWWAVRQLDRVERPDFLPITGYYVAGMVVSTGLVAASAWLPSDWRLGAWAVYAIGWLVGIWFAGRGSRDGISEGILPTDSLVERFGSFTIIVLGEVILGVVSGLAAASPDGLTIATGSIALVVGFGLWWVYFDLVGRRRPSGDRRSIAAWIVSHLPLTLAITAAGAAIVNVVEHAHDPAPPQATAWLLAGSVALGLVALVVIASSLEDAVRLPSVYRPITTSLVIGALVAISAGLLAPAPWVLAAILVAILSALWLFAVAWLIREGAWADFTGG